MRKIEGVSASDFSTPAVSTKRGDLRVLHIINDLRVGGAEVLLANLAPRLRDAAGVETHVVCLAPLDTFVSRSLQASGVPVTCHRVDRLGFRSPAHALQLRAPMRAFDVVHVHLFPAQLWAALAGNGIRLVTTEHNTHNRRRRPFFRPLDAWMYARYAAIVAVSPPTADALAAWVPATKPKTRVIPTAVDVDRFARATPADKQAVLGVPPHTPVLLCIGRFEEQKDHATLLRALPLLPGVHAALVGDGILRGAMERLARTLGVSDRVHFLGHRGDVPALIRMADVYVQPSRWEGWSVAVLEVMAGGTPLVASRAPGLAEAVKDRGLLFAVGDHAGLAAQVQTLLDEPEQGAALARASREMADGFRIERCVEQHRALYEEMLTPRLPTRP